MKLVIPAFVAALVAAPLAGGAASAPVQYSVTLRATIVDRVTYEQAVIDDDCTTRRTGSGGRDVTLRSVRPTSIEVAASRGAAAYRPAWIQRLRAVTIQRGGSYRQAKLCRAMPLETTQETCKASRAVARTVRARFRRPARNRIRFRPARRALVQACGIAPTPLGGWLDVPIGRIAEAALLSGRPARVVARGSATGQVTQSGTVTLKADSLTTVRWTLTFRRL